MPNKTDPVTINREGGRIGKLFLNLTDPALITGKCKGNVCFLVSYNSKDRFDCILKRTKKNSLEIICQTNVSSYYCNLLSPIRPD